MKSIKKSCSILAAISSIVGTIIAIIVAVNPELLLKKSTTDVTEQIFTFMQTTTASTTG